MSLATAQKLIAAGLYSQAETALAGLDDPRASLVLAASLQAQGRGNEAIESLTSLTHLKPDFAPGHLFLAKANIDAGNSQAAITSLDRVLVLQPENDLARSYHSLVLLMEGEQERAADAFRKYGFSDNADFRVRLTVFMETRWIANGDYFFQRPSLSSEPKETQVLRPSTRLAQKSFYAQRYADMLAHLDGAALADRPDESVIFACALGSEMLFDYERSLSYLERLGTDTKDWPDALIAARARSLIRLGRFQEGAEEINRVLIIGPEDYSANYYLGILCLVYNEPERARQLFHRAYSQYVVDTLEFQFWQIERALLAVAPSL